MPVHEIDDWPETTIRRYQYYASQNLMPSKMQHLYFAQMAYISATAGGVRGQLNFDDFMIKLGPAAKPDDSESEMVADEVWEKLRSRSRRRRS